MPKADVMADVRRGREALRQALDGLSDEQMLQAGAVGIWSVKDTLAHLVAWEAELVTMLSRLDQYKHRVPLLVEIEDVDEWNDEQYRTSASRSLAAILDDFHGVHKHLLLTIETLDDRTLDDNSRFAWMEGEPLSYLIAETATWHEEEHAEDILTWREAEGI